MFLAYTAPLDAHHALGAEFDRNAPIRLQGKIVKLEWVNPHTWIHLEITTDERSGEVWMVEGGTPNVLRRRGSRRDCLPPLHRDQQIAVSIPNANRRSQIERDFRLEVDV